jgi:hypothetical protein
MVGFQVKRNPNLKIPLQQDQLLSERPGCSFNRMVERESTPYFIRSRSCGPLLSGVYHLSNPAGQIKGAHHLDETSISVFTQWTENFQVNQRVLSRPDLIGLG